MSHIKEFEKSVKDLQNSVKILKEQQNSYRERLEKLERSMSNFEEIAECLCSECDQKLTCTKIS